MTEQNEKNGVVGTENTGSGPEIGSTATQNTGELTIEKLPVGLLEQITNQINEKWKNEISTRDKKISEYQKNLKEKELEGKTEKEKSELLQKQKEEELQLKAAELEIAQANFLKTKLVAEEKIDPSAIELVIGRSEDEIKASLKKVKDFWNKAEQAGVEKALKGTNTSPQKAQGMINSGLSQLQSQLAEAKKSGNAMLASKLLRMIEEERKKN